MGNDPNYARRIMYAAVAVDAIGSVLLNAVYLNMALDDVRVDFERNSTRWDMKTREERAKELRLYARNCQACAVGGTSRSPQGRESRVGPRSVQNQVEMATKALRYAEYANRISSSTVSFRAVRELQELVRSLEANARRGTRLWQGAVVDIS